MKNQIIKTCTSTHARDHVPLLTNRYSLKIHLHRWIIIKACYYIRNMKLKRPSGANEYDTLADIDGEVGVGIPFTTS